MKQNNFPSILLSDGIIKDQLYHSIREAILDGRLRPGSKIPSSRAMSEMMSISRNSVLSGYERLIDEGYLDTKKGAGTYISATIPDDLINNARSATEVTENDILDLKLNPQIHEMLPLWEKSRPLIEGSTIFKIGVGCVDLFPHQLWGKLLRRVWRHSRNLLGKLNDPAGYKPLRQVICDYVSSSRGLNCTENQIIIVNGTQQAINLTAQVLLQKQDEVWLDEPGYDGALGVFTSVGATVRPVLSDEEGMDISYGIQNWPNAKLVFTAPSHQFPLGGTLSLSRRLALLDWVAENGKWILEDDYNSEFRYTARPIQALQGLDKHQRVIYAGTFSKMMFPEFRLGFLVVPTSLIEVFKLVKYYADTRSPHLEQAALALFISEGHYARHVRRIRKACYERKNILTKAIETYLPEKFRIHPSDSGIHIVCWLLGDLKEGQVIKRCLEIGLEVQPLSRYSQKPLSKQGILIGYAAHTPIELVENIKKLSKLF